MHVPRQLDARQWLREQLDAVFPSAAELILKMVLNDRYKDVTFETLNESGFLESVKAVYPHVDWEKAYNEFKAAGEENLLQLLRWLDPSLRPILVQMPRDIYQALAAKFDLPMGFN